MKLQKNLSVKTYISHLLLSNVWGCPVSGPCTLYQAPAAQHGGSKSELWGGKLENSDYPFFSSRFILITNILQ